MISPLSPNECQRKFAIMSLQGSLLFCFSLPPPPIRLSQLWEGLVTFIRVEKKWHETTKRKKFFFLPQFFFPPPFFFFASCFGGGWRLFSTLFLLLFVASFTLVAYRFIDTHSNTRRDFWKQKILCMSRVSESFVTIWWLSKQDRRLIILQFSTRLLCIGKHFLQKGSLCGLSQKEIE